MEDNNSSSDDESKQSHLSPKLGGKKLKLNDGSSQDSLKEEASSSKVEKDENADSGVSADKSESISSDERAASTSMGPSNEVVYAAPSGSNVRTILLNIRRPRRERNYRKRKTPDRNSDSNDSSSRDSDDLSPIESGTESNNVNSTSIGNSDDDDDNIHRFMATFSGRSSDDGQNSGLEDNESSSGTEEHLHIQSDTDTDPDEGMDETEEDKDKMPSVLLKQRPKHNYFILREIINREMGLTFPCGKAAKTDVMFERKFYGSLHAVFRLTELHQLHKHKGCVNSINFHPEGHLLASGSDDTNVIIWDWARNVPLIVTRTGHKSNVFQSKFLHLNSRSQLNIVTCARDGQVRLIQCPPSGSGSVVRRRLCTHSRAAHKLHVSASEPHIVLSAGEDGLVMQADVRAPHPSKLFQVKERGVTIPLYSVAGHPLEPKQLLVAGRDKFCRVYDRRRSAKPLAYYCPNTFESHNKKKVRPSMMHLTCAVYNHDGTEVLGSYNDEDVYLFDTKQDTHDKDSSATDRLGYTHRYSGHRNSVTFKGVAFFGLNSEYIVSGSDCSYIYIWEKKSEAIVQWMKGDSSGVVNCIEAHPRVPVLATSGLDSDVKIWSPVHYKDPNYEGLARVVRKNVASQLRSPLFNDFLPQLYSAWRGESRFFSDDDDAPYGGNIEFDGNVCTTF